MPGYDWQTIRDREEVPFARGLAMKEGVREYIGFFDEDAINELNLRGDQLSVVVVDYGVAMVYPA